MNSFVSSRGVSGRNTRARRWITAIYYHGISGQLKCVIDRFYSALYPTAPKSLKKVAMFLSSGDADMYDGAKFSYDGDFLGYLGLQGMGIITNHDRNMMEKTQQMVSEL